MKNYYIKAGKIILDEKVLEDVYLEINSGHFGEILKETPRGYIIDL